jgi:hypothetical protein
MCVIPGRGCAYGVVGPYFDHLPVVGRVRNRWSRRRACERPGVEGKTPVAEILAARLCGTQVAWGPRNPV